MIKLFLKYKIALGIGFLLLLLIGSIKVRKQLPIETKDTCNHPSRVSVALCEKKEKVVRLLKDQGLEWNDFHIFIRGFKQEQKLEVWAKSSTANSYRQVITYDFCATIGSLGPKRKEGDLQIPEGLYHIDRFNPMSQFYLSLGLNYPNASDLIRGDKERPGSDIFIHGKCMTAGCIPLTDNKIKELYILANQAIENGQSTIEVHLFPVKMTADNLRSIQNEYPIHASLWEELKLVFEVFERTKEVPLYQINEQGKYVL